MKIKKTKFTTCEDCGCLFGNGRIYIDICKTHIQRKHYVILKADKNGEPIGYKKIKKHENKTKK